MINIQNVLKENKKTLILGLVVAFLYSLPILLANVYYLDDIGRITDSYTWEQDGRLLMTWVTQVLSFDTRFISLFPYSLIASAFIMVIAGVIICSILNIEKEKKYKIIPIIFLCSPFFLENLSFRYDAFAMALSILFGCIPFLYLQRKSFVPISIGLILLILLLYQVSISIYFSIVLCLTAKQIVENKKIDFSVYLKTIFSFFIAYAIYNMIIKFGEFNTFRHESVAINVDTPLVIYHKLVAYYETMLSPLFESGYLYAISPLLLLFIGSIVIKTTNNHRNLWLIPLFIILFLLTFFPNVYIKESTYSPRVLVSFHFFVIFIYLILERTYSSKLKDISLFIIIYFCFTLSALYGAVLKQNEDFYSYLENIITASIFSYQDKNEDENITIISAGKMPIPPRNVIAYQQKPIIQKLAPLYIYEDSYWQSLVLSKNNNFHFPPTLPAEKQKEIANIKNARCHLDIVMKTPSFYLKHKNNVFLIDFNYESCRETS